MARKFLNHPWQYDKQVNQQEKDLKALAGLLANAQKIEGTGYSTMFAIAQHARKHGRDFEAIEESIDKMIEEGYAERKEARFIRLTRKGRALI